MSLREHTMNLVPVQAIRGIPHSLEVREQIKETAAELLATGVTLRQIEKDTGVSRSLIYKLRRQIPEFAAYLDQASYDGTIAVLEELKETPYLEENPHRARVKIDALRQYLELRWPERFGKRMEVRIKTIDIGNALEKARTRAGVTIESIACAVVASDSESSVEDVDPFDEEIDPFDETPGG